MGRNKSSVNPSPGVPGEGFSGDGSIQAQVKKRRDHNVVEDDLERVGLDGGGT